MNILGVGGVELALIFIIALMIAGPKRMLHWAYIMGQYVARMRTMWAEVMQGLQKEIDAAGVDLKLPKDIPTRRDINRLAQNALKPIQSPLQKVMDEVKAEEKVIREATTIPPIALQANGHAVNKAANTSSNQPSDDVAKSDFGTWSGAGKSED